jgi:HEAT repeat protein/Fe-S cluster biogenesis protein NfuA
MFGLFGPNIDKMKQDGDVLGLITVLNHKKQKTREQAAQALAAIGSPAVKPLIAVLGSEDQYTCNYAAWALGVISDDRAVEPLIDALEDTRRSLRRNVVRALLVMADPRAVEPLIAALADPCLEVRRLVIRALGSFGGGRAVGPLLEYQRNHRFTDEEVVGALVKIGQPAVEPLVAALKDDHRGVVAVAATALGKIRDPRTLAPLLAAIQTKVHADVAGALDELGWEPDTSTAAACYWVSKKSWDKCIEIGTAAVDPLSNLIDNPDWPEDARQEARLTLATIAGPDAPPTPMPSTITEDAIDLEDVPQEAQPTLATIAGPGATPTPMPSTIPEDATDLEDASQEAQPILATIAGPDAPPTPMPSTITEDAADLEDVPQEAQPTLATITGTEAPQAPTAIPQVATDIAAEPDLTKQATKPVSSQMKERVEDLINSRVRPTLRSQGRDIHLVDVSDGVAHVSLKCDLTGSERLSLEASVSFRIRELIQEIVFIKFV